MKQQDLVNGKKYTTLRKLYDDQNGEMQAKIRATVENVGFSEGSIYRKLNAEKVDTDIMDALYFEFGIIRHPKQGFFFEHVVADIETFGLS